MLIMYLEDNDQSEDKNDSQLSGTGLSEEAEQLIEELDNMHGDAKEKIFKLIDTLRHDGLKDHQIGKVLVDRVKFVSRTTLYEYMPKELKRDYTRKPLPKTINISTEHKIIDQPTSERPFERTSALGQAEITKKQFEGEEDEDDPKDLEIQFLKEKVTELEEALKKTEQFKPATEYDSHMELNPTPELQLTDDLVFQYLRDRAKETGNILIIDRVGAGALVQALAQYKNSFGVAELFLRIIK